MSSLRKNGSWAIILHGLIFLLIGLMDLFINSNNSYGSIFFLGIMFVAMAFIYALITYKSRGQDSYWYLWMLVALIDLLLGTFIIVKTEKATDYFTILIGSWALVMAVSMFLAAIKTQSFRALIIINGVVSLLFGFLILFNPFPAIMGLNTLIGLYTILFGVSITYLGFLLLRSKSFINTSKPNLE